MHSAYSRANAIFAFMLWVLTVVTLACFLSTVFLDYTTTAKLSINDIKIRKVADYASEGGKADVAAFEFSLNVDVSKLFNWNVKQLFLYLTAEYSSPDHKMNQVVVWDQIVLREKRVVIDERRTRPEYWLLDDGTNLFGNKNVTFVLRYNVVPNAGYLMLSQAEGSVQVEFPSEYSASRER